MNRTTLLNLPFEIRQYIWELSLVPEHINEKPDQAGGWNKHGIDIHHFHSPHYWGTSDMTSLLRVCRQIYEEAIVVLFTRFHFTFDPQIEHDQIRQLKDNLPKRWRNSASVISVYRTLECSASGMREDMKLFDSVAVFTALRELLPSLESVNLYFMEFDSVHHDEAATEAIVQECLKLVAPFRNLHVNVTMLRLSKYNPIKNAQRLEICRRLQHIVDAGGS